MTTRKKPTSLEEWLAYGRALLEDSDIDDAAVDAWLLLEFVTGLTRSEYFLDRGSVLDKDRAKSYETLLRERARHIPLQYLTHEAWCYGNSFYVDSNVLIPRQDTEILIEEALKRMRDGMRVLDLCTGSGCILISLMKQKRISGIGSDLHPEALRIAEKNARKHLVQAEWIRSDLFSDISGVFDMIVSNPPYIPTEDIASLQEEVRDHEPSGALDGGEDGLDFYRAIADEAGARLNPSGWLLVEIGYDQGAAVRTMLGDHGFIETDIIQDYAGLDRVVIGKKR